MFDRLAMAAAALFLACKATDMPVRLDHLCKKFFQLEVARKTKMNPRFQAPPLNDATLSKLIIKITDYEMWLLVSCECSVFPDLPYHYIQDYCSQLDAVTRDSLMRVSTNFANDSFRCQLCLVKSPQTIAKACLYLACRYLSIDLVIECEAEAVAMILELYNSLP
mmetsp:Transcript_20131/g.37442  ORF Transcript_20131/g.37442 Transcript_20131/m.37442 type:complete len:165 (-) Transcript_20131:2671-3165(-)